MFSHCRKGYSLTELVTALVVVSVLMGVAVPNYRVVRLNADAAKAEANLINIYMAQKEFLLDNGRYADDGELSELRKYVDFAINSGDITWRYSIQDIFHAADPDDCTFRAEAWHERIMNPVRPTVTIDQFGEIRRNF